MQTKQFLKFIFLISIVLMNERGSSQIKIGIFADCQYCNCEPAGSRFYRNSVEKLNNCISDFNKNNTLDFIVGLGDLIDRDFKSFQTINTILQKSVHQVCQVSGNHDFSVDKSQLSQVSVMLGQMRGWYSVEKRNWMFLFLNGNEISLHSPNQKNVALADRWLEKLKSENKPNAQSWNGGLGKKQLNWLEKWIGVASRKKQNVAIFCHYPVYPFDAHCLWDSEEVLRIIESSDCVKIWLNGHNHSGNYALRNGVHFVNLKGMVETPTENAFAQAIFESNSIKIEGFGREKSRILKIQ
jgi:predicted phosphodiesterase